MKALREMLSRFLRGTVVSNLLMKFGIDPCRYWLLMDLFDRLGSRREFSLGGAAGFDLKFAEVLVFGFTSLIGALLTFIPVMTVSVFLTIFLVWTTALLVAVLVPEIAYILINPVESLILAHHPINGATYTAAKLSRLSSLFLRFGPKMNIIPAIAAGFFLKEARWFYPLNHMAAIFIGGLFVALLCCSVFGLVIRVIPPTRIRWWIRAAEVVLIVILFTLRLTLGNLERLFRYLFPSWTPYLRPGVSVVSQVIQWPAQLFLAGHETKLPSHPILALGLGLSIAGMLVFGLRGLSADYLIRVHSMVLGGSSAKLKWRRSRLGEIAGRLSGGQTGRAGFEYVRRMMLRDWDFVRRMVRAVPITVGMLVVLLTASSPFQGRSAIHAVPHFSGFIFFWIASSIVYGSQYKAGWIFLTLPNQSFRKFASGVYMSFWLPFIIVPHLIALLVHVWSWGLLQAFATVLFSAALASFYLGLAMKRIDGIPFTKQSMEPPKMGMEQIGGFIVRFLLFVIAVTIQEFLIFTSPWIALVCAVAIACAAYFMTRLGLDSFDTSIRYNLSLLSSGATLYKEVE